MAKGNHQSNRGGRGYRGSPRGGFRGGNGGFQGGGRGRGSSILLEDLQLVAKMHENNSNISEREPTQQGRGRGTSTPKISNLNSGTSTPRRGGRGRGYDLGYGRGSPLSIPRGRGNGRGDSTRRRGSYGIGASPRGRGAGNRAFADPNGSLSSLLYRERPLLRPVVFVPSVYSRVLFTDDDGNDNDELLKPAMGDVPADTSEFKSHAPTADRVFRVFSGNIPTRPTDSSSQDEDIEEIDFHDMGPLLESIEKETTKSRNNITEVVEERFAGFLIKHHPLAGPSNTTVACNSETYTDVNSSVPKEVNVLFDVEMTENTNPDLRGTPTPASMVVDESKPTEPKYLSSPIPVVVGEVLDDLAPTHAAGSLEAVELAPPTFFIDREPVTPFLHNVTLPRVSTPPPILDDEEVIVYVAPHPRKSESASTPRIEDGARKEYSPYTRAAGLPASSNTSVSIPSSSASPFPPTSVTASFFSFSRTTIASEISDSGRSNTPRRFQIPAISTPRMSKVVEAKQRKHARRVRSKRKKQDRKPSGGLELYGAMMQERELRGEGWDDHKWEQRRRGDSDLDWGDEDGGDGGDEEAALTLAELTAELNGSAGRKDKRKGKAKEVLNTAEGMDVDPELVMDDNALKAFVGGVLGRDEGRFTTMDDIRDAEMMRLEDEGDRDGRNSESEDDSEDREDEEDEIDKIIALEEALIVSEPDGVVGVRNAGNHDGDDDDDDDDDDVSDDEEATPRTSFQARLDRLRKLSQRQKAKDDSEDDDSEDEEEDEDGFLNRNMTWAEQDECFLAHAAIILDDNEELLTRKDKKLFKSIRDGDFDDMDDFVFAQAKRKKDKHFDLSAELEAQWDADRAKKATYKKERALEKLLRASDPLAQKKGGVKGRKAMRAAARLDPTITVLPNRIIDITTLVQQIRRFIADIGGPKSMSLPPTAKETRKNVHELAIAFGLKSQSRGKGDSRYTTLTKTTRTVEGWADEAKIARITKRAGGAGSWGNDFSGSGFGKGKGKAPAMPRHKEGEEVGKAAPKIDASNIGFRMLAMMGWSEGNRIGVSGGLEAPLTAIIKHSKLGLGAMG